MLKAFQTEVVYSKDVAPVFADVDVQRAIDFVTKILDLPRNSVEKITIKQISGIKNNVMSFVGAIVPGVLSAIILGKPYLFLGSLVGTLGMLFVNFIIRSKKNKQVVARYLQSNKNIEFNLKKLKSISPNLREAVMSHEITHMLAARNLIIRHADSFLATLFDILYSLVYSRTNDSEDVSFPIMSDHPGLFVQGYTDFAAGHISKKMLKAYDNIIQSKNNRSITGGLEKKYGYSLGAYLAGYFMLIFSSGALESQKMIQALSRGEDLLMCIERFLNKKTTVIDN